MKLSHLIQMDLLVLVNSLAQVSVIFSCILAISVRGRVTLVSDFCFNSTQTSLIQSRTK